MEFELPATLIFVLVTTFTPGPNNILSTSMGALYGYRRAAPFMLGVVSGFLIIMALCATASTLLSTYLPEVAPKLRPVGALYILWLAIGVYRSSSLPTKRTEDARPLRFWNGLTLQFVNPKCIFFGLTIYSVFLAPLLTRRLVLLGSTLLLACVTFSAVSTWALGGQLIRGWINTPRRAQALGLVLALALVYTAVDLAGLLPW